MNNETPELSAAIDEYDRAVRERDHAAAEAVLDPDYALVLVQPEPAIMPRARWLAVLDDYIVHAWTVEEQHIHIRPDGHLAAVMRRVHMKATVLGQDRSGLFILSDVWRHDGTRWRVWRRHSTPIEAGTMPGA